MAEFVVYIRNNQESIPNYGQPYRQGETISTAFVESTITQVVSRCFVKNQQMHWTLHGAHLLLQTRTEVLNNEVQGAFGGGIRYFEFKRKRRDHRVPAALQAATAFAPRFEDYWAKVTSDGRSGIGVRDTVSFSLASPTIKITLQVEGIQRLY